MKLLVLDGNSIVNRAFYGIKLLTNKNGEYTNAIYGFLNILLKLEDICSPDAVAVAFDVHAPTFRHKMYDEYKAGRKGMPDELRAQMPVLKEMLKNLGIKTIEKKAGRLTIFSALLPLYAEKTVTNVLLQRVTGIRCSLLTAVLRCFLHAQKWGRQLPIFMTKRRLMRSTV